MRGPCTIIAESQSRSRLGDRLIGEQTERAEAWAAPVLEIGACCRTGKEKSSLCTAKQTPLPLPSELSSHEKLWRRAANAISISVHAKLRPTHSLCPVPNGIQAKLNALFESPFASETRNLSGRNSLGLDQWSGCRCTLCT